MRSHPTHVEARVNLPRRRSPDQAFHSSLPVVRVPVTIATTFGVVCVACVRVFRCRGDGDCPVCLTKVLIILGHIDNMR